MEKQVCPKCKSENIRTADEFSKMGNPILSQSAFGWECLDCGYVGKNFFIMVKDSKKNKTLKKNIKKKILKK